MKAWPEKPVPLPCCVLDHLAAAPGHPQALESLPVHTCPQTCSAPPSRVLTFHRSWCQPYYNDSRPAIPSPALHTQPPHSAYFPPDRVLNPPLHCQPWQRSGFLGRSHLPAFAHTVSGLWPQLKTQMKLGKHPVQCWCAPCTRNTRH